MALPPKDNPSHRRLAPAIRIALIYAIVAGLWIFASDRLLDLFIQDIHSVTRFATYKGLTFVAVTALMLFGLVRHATGIRQEAAAPSLV